jgi:predicted nucleic acid-binding protein
VTPVFLDTVGLLAVWDVTDQWNAAADAAYRDITRRGRQVLTTPLVIWECGNAAARRPFRQRVNVLRQRLMNEGLLIEPAREEIEAAWAAYDRGEASHAGIVDHISFVVMRRLGLTQAFTNDAHFRAAGYETLF